jgi:hypothetical protein
MTDDPSPEEESDGFSRGALFGIWISLAGFALAVLIGYFI